MTALRARRNPAARLLGTLLVLWVAFAGSSCVGWSDEYWSFPMTRRAYVDQTATGWAETHPGDPGTDPDLPGYAGGAGELDSLTFLLTLPLLIDLVLLPVTAIHDLFVLD